MQLLFVSTLLPILVAGHQSVEVAQPKPRLTVERVFGPYFNATDGGLNGTWLPDGRRQVTLARSAKLKGALDLVIVDVVSNKRSIFVSAESLVPKGKKAQIEIESFDITPDRKQVLIYNNSQKVWRTNTRGDYWLLNLKTNQLRQLGAKAKPSSLMFAKLSPNGLRVAYVRENNLYVEDIATGKITPLTTDGTKTISSGTFDWVYEEELSLQDGWRWSPDGKSIAYWRLDATKEPLFTMINNTDTQYPTTLQFPYPLAGGVNATAKVGVVPAEGGATKWMDVTATNESGYIGRMEWAANSTELMIRKIDRLQQVNDFRIADVKTGKSRSVFVDRDPAYVETGTNDTSPLGVRWINGGKQFLTLSEQDGWRHLYSVPRTGGKPTLLTPEKYDIDKVEGYSEAKNLVYFTASPDSAIQRYLYAVNLDGKSLPVRLTPADVSGTSQFRISPTGEYAFARHFQFGVPPDVKLVTLPEYKPVRLLTDNAALKKKLKDEDLGETRFMTVKTADGQPMDVSLILPPNMDPNKRYPVFFYVYGEPWGTTVNDAWEGTTYLYHQLLAQRGYIVASADSRGTPSLKGRAWRKSIYRKLGQIASEDQAAACRQISELPFVDKSRVGIWGWSGGGTMTLQMMFRYPDLYHVGISVASVPDEMLYDTIYQERYMGLPTKNAKDYRESSAIDFAQNLKGSLLIVHGTGDDNVHYQGAERLINRLIELGKPFQMMAYPNRTHNISEGPGTTLHLYNLMEKYLLTHLPPGGR